ncbi:WD repeat-containing protein CG11141 [Sitodiplosis mosellana]|uniref:WD repeat-containing protein CG11141 n=1 Tax=Sitodiplosis mosellana TaxID=263140 RepID=UPI002444A1AE|nr:WD repeat-containing protein CG11141 [Sitodiplosis mosellana]
MESDEFDLNNLREWKPTKDVFEKIPPKIQRGFFFQELNITCIDVLPEFLAIGSDVGIIFWYNRRNGNVQKLRTESTAAITCIRLVSSVEYMVAAGNAHGEVSIFQIQKELPSELASHEIAASLITFKPIERYTIKDVYRGAITCVEWSKNGMKLFSGDNHGIVVMTELDFGQHICKSMEVINEKFGIVQMQFCNPYLLVSTLYRAVVCKRDEMNEWQVSQIGRTDRKVLNDFGAVFTPIDVDHRKPPSVIGARPGFRFWMADVDGNVSHTFLLKESVNEFRSIFEVPLLNPVHSKVTNIKDTYFGPCHYYMGKYIVTYCESMVFIVNLEKLKVMATIKRLRNIQYLTVNGNEIFIVEGGRSIVRISIVPDGLGLAGSTQYVSSNNNNMMNDSNIEIQEETVTQADECFELPPIETIHLNVPLACRIGEHQLLKEDKLLLEHSKKLQVFEKINTLDYDESILFQTGTKKKKKTSVHSTSSDEAKIDGVVEIGRQAEFFTEQTNEFDKTNQQIIDRPPEISSFTESTTKPCLMQASFCDFLNNGFESAIANTDPNKPLETKNGATTAIAVKKEIFGSYQSLNSHQSLKSHQRDTFNRKENANKKEKLASPHRSSPEEQTHLKPVEWGYPAYPSNDLFNRQSGSFSNNSQFRKSIVDGVPMKKSYELGQLMYPNTNRPTNRISRTFHNGDSFGEQIINGISVESPLSEVSLTSEDDDDDEDEPDAIDSLDAIKQCANNRTPVNSPPKPIQPPPAVTADPKTVKYLSSLANLPKLWDIKIEKCDENQYNGDANGSSNGSSTKEGSDSEWVFL